MTTIAHRIRLEAPPHQVYQALATADGLRSWYTALLDGDVAEGQTATFRFTGQEPFQWRFTELTPDATARWECLDGPGNAPGTTVTFDVHDAGNGQTVLECEHAGWADEGGAFRGCNTRWGILMGSLKNYVETKTPAPAFR